MGDMAEYTDSTTECAVAKGEFLSLWRDIIIPDSTIFPKHYLYQNTLMDKGFSLEKRQSIASELYHLNSSKKVRDACICPSCGTPFNKTHYQQKFCKNKTKGFSSCKDFFHNFVNPSRMARLNWDM